MWPGRFQLLWSCSLEQSACDQLPLLRASVLTQCTCYEIVKISAITLHLFGLASTSIFGPCFVPPLLRQCMFKYVSQTFHHAVKHTDSHDGGRMFGKQQALELSCQRGVVFRLCGSDHRTKPVKIKPSDCSFWETVGPDILDNNSLGLEPDIKNKPESKKRGKKRKKERKEGEEREKGGGGGQRLLSLFMWTADKPRSFQAARHKNNQER